MNDPVFLSDLTCIHGMQNNREPPAERREMLSDLVEKRPNLFRNLVKVGLKHLNLAVKIYISVNIILLLFLSACRRCASVSSKDALLSESS